MNCLERQDGEPVFYLHQISLKFDSSDDVLKCLMKLFLKNIDNWMFLPEHVLLIINSGFDLNDVDTIHEA